MAFSSDKLIEYSYKLYPITFKYSKFSLNSFFNLIRCKYFFYALTNLVISVTSYTFFTDLNASLHQLCQSQSYSCINLMDAEGPVLNHILKLDPETQKELRNRYDSPQRVSALLYRFLFLLNID